MKAEFKVSLVPVIAGLARKLPHVTRRIVCCFCDSKQREYDSGMSKVSFVSIMYSIMYSLFLRPDW